MRKIIIWVSALIFLLSACNEDSLYTKTEDPSAAESAISLRNDELVENDLNETAGQFIVHVMEAILAHESLDHFNEDKLASIFEEAASQSDLDLQFSFSENQELEIDQILLDGLHTVSSSLLQYGLGNQQAVFLETFRTDIDDQLRKGILSKDNHKILSQLISLNLAFEYNSELQKYFLGSQIEHQNVKGPNKRRPPWLNFPPDCKELLTEAMEAAEMCHMTLDYVWCEIASEKYQELRDCLFDPCRWDPDPCCGSTDPCCGVICTPGSFCDNGICTTIEVGPVCPPGYIWKGGVCIEVSGG